MDELSAGEPADLRGRTGAPVGWPEEDRRRYKEYWDSTNIDELEVEQGELQSGRLAIVRDILDAELGTAADLIVQLRALAADENFRCFDDNLDERLGKLVHRLEALAGSPAV